MKIKLSWTSWVALALLPISIVAVFYFSPWAQVPERIINSDLRFSLMLPLAALASYTCIVFLVKSKTMSSEFRLPWIMYSIATFAFLLVNIMTTLENSLIIIDRPQILNIFMIVMGLGFLLLPLSGMIAEVSKPSWKGRKSSTEVFVIIVVVLLVAYIFIDRTSVVSEIILTAFTHLIMIFICAVIIQKDGKEKVSFCYKVILPGFVVFMAGSILDKLFKNSNWTNISAITFLTCFIIAADIRTNIWLEESATKVSQGIEAQK
ncbi:MAG: hypothetical protein KA140_06390 [Caldisericia bacterium]|nr:hypothetical protein [Caldisericia bacterium]